MQQRSSLGRKSGRLRAMQWGHMSLQSERSDGQVVGCSSRRGVLKFQHAHVGRCNPTSKSGIAIMVEGGHKNVQVQGKAGND